MQRAWMMAAAACLLASELVGAEKGPGADVRVTQRDLSVLCVDRQAAAKGRRFTLAPGEHTLTLTMSSATTGAGTAKVRFTAESGHRYELEVRAEPTAYMDRTWRRGEWRPVVRDRGEGGPDDGTPKLVGSDPEWLEGTNAACGAAR